MEGRGLTMVCLVGWATWRSQEGRKYTAAAAIHESKTSRLTAPSIFLCTQEKLECFPFNVCSNPMYNGSTLSFLGTALW